EFPGGPDDPLPLLRRGAGARGLLQKRRQLLDTGREFPGRLGGEVPQFLGHLVDFPLLLRHGGGRRPRAVLLLSVLIVPVGPSVVPAVPVPSAVPFSVLLLLVAVAPGGPPVVPRTDL